ICSAIFGGVLEKFPALRIAFAHGGGSFPATLGRIRHGFDCRPDLVAIDNQISPEKYLGRFWLDSLVHDPKMLNYIVDMFGPARVALGSDYPFPLGENCPGMLIKNMKWPDEKKEMLLSGAALEWLQMTREDFLT
ncbi:MAG TPA: amidohydrolase family protein, partial [Bacteroidia bacterium]|nr:amidohydrolase family protein [Bacteroidia bacterium]